MYRIVCLLVGSCDLAVNVGDVPLDLLRAFGVLVVATVL